MAQTVLKTASPSSTWAGVGIDLRRGVLLALGVAFVAVFVLSLVVGSVNIPLGDVLTILLGGVPERATWTTIILDSRLPRAVTAALAGAALAVSGLQMQTFFRNPLADPFVLGISSGASLGVALVVLGAGVTGGATLLAGVSTISDWGLAFAASVGAGVVMMLVLAVARRVRSVMTLLILGLMFGYVTGSLVSLLMHFSLAERIRAYISWTYGSFSGVTWNQLEILVPVVIIGLGTAFLMAKPLNALLLGETYARSMGLNVGRARFWIIVSTALLAGGVTAFCGPIGFIGVAVPHLCRSLLNTSDHRILFPAAVLLGGLTALVAALIAQVPGSDVVLPLNAVTALIGAPIVMWVILRRQNVRETLAG